MFGIGQESQRLNGCEIAGVSLGVEHCCLRGSRFHLGKQVGESLPSFRGTGVFFADLCPGFFGIVPFFGGHLLKGSASA